MADQAQPPHDSPTPMSRSAKRRRNEKLYVESDLVRARKERREALRAWKMTESVEERRLLADRLLNAMNQEDEATATRKEELSYISWIDRCTAGDYVASLPITLLPVSLPEASLFWHCNLTVVDEVPARRV